VPINPDFYDDPKNREFAQRIDRILYPEKHAALARESQRYAEFLKNYHASRGSEEKPKEN